MSRAPLQNPADAVRFLRGGRAVLTIQSRKSGEHRTYRVSRKVDEDGKASPFFVSLLTGPDNERDFTYLGVLAEDNTIRLTRASKLTAESIPVRAFNYVGRKLGAGELPADADLMHEGRCGCCGRTLTVPESVRTGLGPECARRRTA